MPAAVGKSATGQQKSWGFLTTGKKYWRWLRKRKAVLNVFIHSSWEARVKRAVETYGVDAANAEVVLKKFDKRRACYYNANTGKKWSAPEGYHMILDSGRLGIGKCVDILEKAVE